ncbi:MAG: 4Fe-4S binding protein [Clostridia bacterium]|nr:4Fe-4S binding protein [Clostridia bacterium]
MLTTILIAIGVVVGVVGFTLLISFFINKSKRLNSKETFVHSLLPELDCGKCGCPNCEAFSKEVADERQDISACPYILKANLSKANRVLKKGYVNNSNMIACIKCKGGKDCKNKFEYQGQQYCWCMDSLHSGAKMCDRACLGCGDCVRVCRYGAIFINEKGVAEVDRAKCTGCGACTYVCPNKLIERIPASKQVEFICSNNTDKMGVTAKCKVGCTGCGLCAKICPHGAIEMKNGNPVIDEKKCTKCNKCIGACPNSCISRL